MEPQYKNIREDEIKKLKKKKQDREINDEPAE